MRNNGFLKFLFSVFILAVFLIPLERIGGFDFFGLNIRFSQILTIFIFISYLFYSLYEKKLKIKISTPLSLYILFLLSCLISLVFAYEKLRGVMIFLFLFFMIIVPYITILLVDSKKRLKNVIYSLLLSAGIFSMFGIFQFFGDMLGIPNSITGLSSRYVKEVLGFPRIQSTFIEPLYFANYLLIPFFITLFFIIKKTDPRRRFLFLAYLIFILGVILLTVSKGAILGLSFGILFLILFQIKSVFSKQNLPYLFGILIFLTVIFWGAYSSLKSTQDFEKYYTKAYDIITGASIRERAEAYSVALEAYQKSPIIGIGVGNFGPYFSGYPNTAPDFGWPIANNQYLEILSEVGIIGLFLFLIFIISIFYYSIKAYKNTHDSFLKASLLGLNFALLAIIIQYLTFSTLYIMHIWFLIGIILATQEIILKNEDY